MFDLIIRNAKLVDGTARLRGKLISQLRTVKLLKSGQLMPKPRLKLMPKVIW